MSITSFPRVIPPYQCDEMDATSMRGIEKQMCAHPHVRLGHRSKDTAHVRVDTLLFYTTDSYKYGKNNMSFTHLWLYAILLQLDIHNKTSIAHKFSRTQAQKCNKPNTLCSISSTVIMICWSKSHFLNKICLPNIGPLALESSNRHVLNIKLYNEKSGRC